MNGSLPLLLDLSTGWLLFLSVTVSIGAAVGRWAVLPLHSGETGGPPSGLEESAARLGLGGAASLIVALALVLLRQILEFRDPFAPWGEDTLLLLGGTSWGTTWLVALAVTLLALAGFWLASRGRQAAWAPVTVTVLALGAFPALTGHANSGELKALTLTADILHVWAVGGWLGGLSLVLWLEWRLGRGGGDRDAANSLLPALVRRFSPLAMVCVATLVASGVTAGWIQLDGVGALFGTTYGRLLLAKVALVLGVLALGAVNWRRLTPRLGDSGGQRAMRRAAALEILLANVVLMVTAILVRTSP